MNADIAGFFDPLEVPVDSRNADAQALEPNIWMLWLWILGYSSLWMAGIIISGSHREWGYSDSSSLLESGVLLYLSFLVLEMQSTGNCHHLFLCDIPKSKYIFFLGLIVEWPDENGNISWADFSSSGLLIRVFCYPQWQS